MRLTPRLLAVLDAIPVSGVIADVGTDHGFLPLSAIKKGLADRVIATDISSKSLAKARRLFSEAGLTERADFRVGDGLSVIGEGEVDVVVISGMGGVEICKIVSSAPRFPVFVLSPQHNEDLVRRTMNGLGYRSVSEVTVESEGKYYFVMRYEVGTENLSDLEIEFGKHNLASPSRDFISYVKKLACEYGKRADEHPTVDYLRATAQKYEAVLLGLRIKNEG